ncbi:MAG: mechanosensitive ion channel domain-containing protein [Sulfurimonas sp.]
MKKILIVLLFLAGSALFGSYTKFIDTQLDNYYKLDEQNLSKEQIEEIVSQQSKLYDQELKALWSDKKKYARQIAKYDKEIYSLQKVININQRAGNSAAVLRDEVKVKSYRILKAQGSMFQNLLNSLGEKSFDEFENYLGLLVNKNQEEVSKIDNKDYKQYLTWEPNSQVVYALQENIKEYYALLELNRDIIVHLYRLKDKFYKLNKYARYHLIDFVFVLESVETVSSINHFLEEYGLDVVKLILMLFASIVVYILRRVVLVVLRDMFKRVDFFRAYAQKIVKKLTKPIHTLFIVISLHLIVYIYNDFSSVEVLKGPFSIIYALYATYMFYVVVNSVAMIKLSSLDVKTTHIRKDLINVSIKIVNFVIMIVGLLLVLYFAGVDLTAVLSGLGIGGFALAFAAKDTISNFFGTVSILFSDVFSQGDWIVVDDKEGTVVEIGLRVTTIRTFDNALIAIPNGVFASKEVKNWNKRKVGRRIKMNIGVTYNSKPDDLKKAVAEIREMLLKHPRIATPHKEYEYEVKQMTKLVSKDNLEGVKTNLLVYLDQFSSSSIDILLYCFSTSVQWEEWLATKEDVMHKIMDILERNSLEFAFPSMSIYQEK